MYSPKRSKFLLSILFLSLMALSQLSLSKDSDSESSTEEDVNDKISKLEDKLSGLEEDKQAAQDDYDNCLESIPDPSLSNNGSFDAVMSGMDALTRKSMKMGNCGAQYANKANRIENKIANIKYKIAKLQEQNSGE